jgi:hypothetical protein
MRTHSRSLALALAALLVAAPAFAQSASAKKKERHLARIAGMAGGAFAGLMVGWAVSDDDAVNATAKLARNWAIGAAVGGVGGYFLGRTIDRRISFDSRRSPQEIRWAQARQVERIARELGRRVAAPETSAPQPATPEPAPPTP